MTAEVSFKTSATDSESSVRLARSSATGAWISACGREHRLRITRRNGVSARMWEEEEEEEEEEGNEELDEEESADSELMVGFGSGAKID